MIRRISFALVAISLASCAQTKEEFDESRPDSTTAAGNSTTKTEEHADAPESSTVAPNLIADCVDYVRFGAFTGNALLVSMWNDATQDAATLWAHCDQLGRSNLVGLKNMSAQWIEVEALVEASQATLATQLTVPQVAPQTPPPTNPPPAPVAAQAPSSPCDPNYTGCVPIASDVDCNGGTGDGPAYTAGPVTVIGSDIYELDRDADGQACEGT